MSLGYQSGRCLLVILNIVFMLVGAVVVVCGAVMKWIIAEVLKDEVTSAMSVTAYKEIIHDHSIPNVVEFEPLTQGAALLLLSIGGGIFILSFLACCGACLESKPLLCLFTIFVILILVLEITIFTLIFSPNSKMHNKNKKYLRNSFRITYIPQSGSSYTASADLVMVTLQCCGITGQGDFKNMSLFYEIKKKQYETEVPPSCCKHRFLEVNDLVNCSTKPTKDNTSQQGCYDAIFELINIHKTWMILVFGFVVSLQAIEVMIIVCCGKGSKIDGF